MDDDALTAAWQPVIDRFGEDLGVWRWTGADVIDPGMIRRLCEVLEFDCPLHHDADAARAHGHPDLVAPYTAALPFSLPPLRSPGEPSLFVDDARDAQPERSVIAGLEIPGAPPTTGFMVTEIDTEFARPARVGERLRQTGLTLLAFRPRQTRVGRGAFMTFETDIRGAEDERVATIRMTTFSYDPVTA